MSEYLNPREFGALGDGITDDTKAVQTAIDKSAETGMPVYITAGRYSCGELYMRPEVTVKADPTWAYRSDAVGKTVLLQRDDGQACLIDMTTANGSTLTGLSLAGTGKGNCVGILSRKKDYGTKEDAYRIDSCRVSGFGSHAVYLDRIWCFSVRHCMFAFSGGDGLCITGWDGFVIDNWFSGNKGAGWGGRHGANASITMTGNRIEWNAEGGIIIKDGSHYNITGNYIDRSGKSAIEIDGGKIISCTGNILYRSGKYEADDPVAAQCILKDSAGVTFVGNSFCAGRDDGGKGDMSPSVALRILRLTDSVVASNAMHTGSLNKVINDGGGHVNTIIQNNMGSILGRTE